MPDALWDRNSEPIQNFKFALGDLEYMATYVPGKKGWFYRRGTYYINCYTDDAARIGNGYSKSLTRAIKRATKDYHIRNSNVVKYQT